MMNKAFVLVALSTVSMLSADYYAPYNPSCPGGNCPYPSQGRSYYDNRPYYQDRGDRYDDRTYYQGSSSYYDGRSGQYQDGRGYHDGRGYYDGRSGQYQDGRGYYDGRSGQYSDRTNYQDNRNQDRDGYYNPNSSSSSRYNDDRNNSRKNAVTDEDIAKEVHDHLEANWLSKGYPDVTFDVKNGVVNLRGRVETRDEKTKLENAIRKIDGVKQVNSDVTAVQDRTTSSRMMKNGHWANTDRSYNDRNYHEGSDRNYHESSDRNYSNTAVDKDYPRDTAATESDRQINSKIRDRLSGWFTKGYETIILNTENGVVTVTGFVETPDEVQKVTKEAKAVEGVRSVNNRASVQPKK